MTDRGRATLAAALAAMLFGSSYVATAFQLRGFAPLPAAFSRTTLGAAAMIGLLVVQTWRSASPAASASTTTASAHADATRTVSPPVAVPPVAARLVRLVVLGLLGGLVFVIGMAIAVSRVGATVTSFVAGLYAITGALFAPVVLGEPLERRAAAGFVVALVGTALLADLGPSPAVLEGLAAGGVAALSFGLYLVLVRRWSRAIAVGPLGISLASAATSSVGLALIVGMTAPETFAPRTWSTDVVLSTAWLGVVTVTGPLLAAYALRRIEAGLASAMLLLNPVTATILSALLLGERPSPLQLVGGMLVLTGMAVASDLVAVVNARRASTHRPGDR